MDESINQDRCKELADLCVEFWKLAKGTTKAIDFLPQTDAKRLISQVKYSERQLERLAGELGLRLVELEGEAFHAGIAASADNAEDFEDDIPLVVTKTLEPAVIKDMRIIRTGRVLVDQYQTSEE